MPEMNWDYAGVGFSLALPLVLMVEVVRGFAGFYDGLPWYAALVRGYIRVMWTGLSFAAFAAYVMGGGVRDALALSTDTATEHVFAPPGIVLMLLGGAAFFVALGLSEVGAMLTWAVARRRIAWKVFAHLEAWFYREAERAVEWTVMRATFIARRIR